VLQNVLQQGKRCANKCDKESEDAKKKLNNEINEAKTP
jgi:hypothetical protein